MFFFSHRKRFVVFGCKGVETWPFHMLQMRHWHSQCRSGTFELFGILADVHRFGATRHRFMAIYATPRNNSSSLSTLVRSEKKYLGAETYLRVPYVHDVLNLLQGKLFCSLSGLKTKRMQCCTFFPVKRFAMASLYIHDDFLLRCYVDQLELRVLTFCWEKRSLMWQG